MSKVDWSKAPEDADFYSCGHIYKAAGSSLYSASYEKYLRAIDKLALGETLKANDKWSWCLSFHDLASIKGFSDYEKRPQQWPSESRIDIIGTNGNTAEHYMEEHHEKVSTGPSVYETRKHYETQAELAVRIKAELEAKQKVEIEAKEKAQAKPQNKYDREIVGKYNSGKCIVDVYRVLVAFGDIPPEIQHAIKKLLAGGKRGHKDEGLDYLEAIQSIESYLNRLDDSSD